ncbi:unnamed protein product [Nyctereutes procyonoides]|uniref:(raccoon dog) hypothetical protein n=1 Tax=Nyctereutes procyonoides TaxID=34880 RepID=A0A811YR12_NYCPR|nr:unnamed protein product [Nyctereutes procyonoides]
MNLRQRRKAEVEGKPGHNGKLHNEGQPDDKKHPEDEEKQESRAIANKCLSEDYIPKKAKRKTDRGMDDSPKDYQEDLEERHLGRRAKKKKKKKKKKRKMGGFHWMQGDVQDPFTPRKQRGIRGMQDRGRGQRSLHDIPYL